MLYNTQGSCQLRDPLSETVNEQNLNEKVIIGEGSFDGNPHWGKFECVFVCAAAAPLLYYFQIFWLKFDIAEKKWTVNFNSTSPSVLSLCSPYVFSCPCSFSTFLSLTFSPSLTPTSVLFQESHFTHQVYEIFKNSLQKHFAPFNLVISERTGTVFMFEIFEQNRVIHHYLQEAS